MDGRAALTWQAAATRALAASGARLTRGVTTLCYAAPEMLVLRETYGYPADIWSLGIVMLEIEATMPVLLKNGRTTNLEQLLEIVSFLPPTCLGIPRRESV